MKVHRSTPRYLMALAVLAAPVGVQAQGFGVNEIGSCALARGYAVTSAPCKDASVIFWNPAAATSLSGWSVLAGAASIGLDASFTQDTTFRTYDADLSPEIVPHAFVNYHAPNSRVAWGLGLYVPYGLTSQWTDSFPGRFSAKKASLQTIYFQPNVAFKINDKWSVGGGPVIGHSSVELIQAVDLSQQVAGMGPGGPITFASLGIPTRTEFARASLNGDAMGYGVQVGVMGQLARNWSFGARFLSSIVFDYDDADATFEQKQTGLVLPPGNPVCSQIPGCDTTLPLPVDQLVAGQFSTGGALVAQKVATRIAHPAQVQLGFGYTGVPNWTLSADYAWIGWKQFTDLPVEFKGPAAASNRVLAEDYNNSSAIRLGAQRDWTNGAAFRLGFAGVASAAPDITVTPLLPEQDRMNYMIGGAIPLVRGLVLDAAYSRIVSNGRRGRIDERIVGEPSESMTAAELNTGVYDLSANIFSISLKASF